MPCATVPLINKTLTDLNTSSVARLLPLGYTDAQYTGTAVRNIVESVNISLSSFYGDLNYGLLNYALSTATGTGLDALVFLLGITRRAGESDANLVYRATNALTVAGTANLTALLDALFALDGIADVIAVPFTQGIGSISFYLIGTAGIPSVTTQALATAALTEILAAGAYAIVDLPNPVLLNAAGTLTIAPGNSLAVGEALAQTAATRYLANLSMGAPFIVTAFEAAILGAGTQIVDFNLVSMSVTGATGTQELIVANYQPFFSDQIQPGVLLIQ